MNEIELHNLLPKNIKHNQHGVLALQTIDNVETKTASYGGFTFGTNGSNWHEVFEELELKLNTAIDNGSITTIT